MVREQAATCAACSSAWPARRLPPERIDAVLVEARLRRAFVPILVREDLTWDEVAQIAVHTPELPGVVLDPGLLRAYPEGEAPGARPGLCRGR